MNNDERRVYELGYHLVSTLTDENVQQEVEGLKKSISELDAKIISEAEPELMDLAYTMFINEGGKNVKFDKAYFGWIKFEVHPSKIDLFKEDTIDENKNILRYLLIKTVAEDTIAEVNLEELKEVKNDDVIKTKHDKEEVSTEEKEVDEKALESDLDATIDKLLD